MNNYIDFSPITGVNTTGSTLTGGLFVNILYNTDGTGPQIKVPSAGDANCGVLLASCPDHMAGIVIVEGIVEMTCSGVSDGEWVETNGAGVAITSTTASKYLGVCLNASGTVATIELK